MNLVVRVKLQSRPVFSNLFKVVEHLIINLSENPSYLRPNFSFSLKYCGFLIFGEHFKTACRALVVHGVVVGNH